MAHDSADSLTIAITAIAFAVLALMLYPIDRAFCGNNPPVTYSNNCDNKDKDKNKGEYKNKTKQDRNLAYL